MTPEPEPEPDPEPTTRTIHVKGTTTLSNSHMFRLYNVNDLSVILNGGKVSVNQFTDMDITIPLNTSFMLRVKSKGSNNSYPNYTDSYYDDATTLKSNGGMTYIVIAADRADGSTLTVTQTDSDQATISWS